MSTSRFCPRGPNPLHTEHPVQADHPVHTDRAGASDAPGRAEEMEAFAADILGLTPDQRAAFDGFVAGMRAAEADLRAAAAARPDSDEPAPLRLDRIATVLTAAQEGLARVRPSFEAFYGGLDGLQRRAVDRFAGGGGAWRAGPAQSPNSEPMGRE